MAAPGGAEPGAGGARRAKWRRWCRRCSTPTRPTTTLRSKSPRWGVGIRIKKKKKPKFWLWWLKGPRGWSWRRCDALPALQIGAAAGEALPLPEERPPAAERSLRGTGHGPGVLPRGSPSASGRCFNYPRLFPTPNPSLLGGPGAGGEVERFPVLLAGPLGSCLSPRGAPELQVLGCCRPSSPPPVPAVSGRQPPLALLLDPAQLGAAGGAHPRRRRL